jgi:gluconolactonase
MFAPPPVQQASIWTRMPDALRLKGRMSKWLEIQHGGPLDSFLEGPSFDREGNLYLVDVAHGRVFRISPAGDWQVIAAYDGEPNGLKIHKDGRIFIADYKNGLMLLDPASGEVKPYLTRVGLEPFKGLNDLVFASNGDLYFTDQGLTGLHDPTGRLFRLTAAGRLECLLANIPSPNGLVLSADERTVFVAVTRGNCIWRVPMRPDGGLMKVGMFVQLSGGAGGGPDGLAMDEASNLAIAHVTLGSVWIMSPVGEPVLRITAPKGLRTTNLAYGGPGNQTLYITESDTGSVLTARLSVPGRRMYSHQ